MVLYSNQVAAKEKRNTICNEVFANVPMVIYTRKHFFLLDELNMNIELLKAAGLIDFWYFQFIDKKFSKSPEKARPIVLTLVQFQGCFGIFLSGIAISLIVFMIETSKFKLCLLKVFKFF